MHTSPLKRTHLTSHLNDQVNKEVVLMGWVHDVRVLGGIAFLLLRDQAGIVQVTAPKAKAPPEVLKEIGTLHQEDVVARSEEHTSELQSRQYLVCRLLL